MSQDKNLTEQFARSRLRLKALAYRMLGNIADADDALHDSWLRMSKRPVDLEEIENIEGWLTTVVARVCLNKLRARKARPEDTVGLVLPDLLITDINETGAEHEVHLSEQVGFALQVVLETLAPAERVAFVLHDLFGFSFDNIASMLDRTPEATRKLASRGRRRIQHMPDTRFEKDRQKQRDVVTAFFAASQRGDINDLLRILHPDVTFVSDGGILRVAATATLRGSDKVARRAASFAVANANLRWLLVNGSTGVIVESDHGPVSVMVFMIEDNSIREIYSLLDPERIGQQIMRADAYLN